MTSASGSARRRNVCGTGFDKFLEHFGTYLSDFSAVPEKTKFSWQSDFASTNGLTCWRLRGTAGYLMNIDYAEETLFISQPIVGGFFVGNRQKAVTALPGALFTGLANGPAQFRTSGTHARAVLRIERPVLLKALTDLNEGMSLSQLTPQMLHYLSDDTTQPLYHSTQATISAIFEEQIPERCPKAMALQSESLLAFVINRLTADKLREPPKMTPHRLKLAVEYMHAFMHNSLTLADIATAAGVSIRTLQSAFKNNYSTTPAAYLRRIRLKAARAELISAENTLPVSEVALKWGFRHMGRFAELYRKTYGVLPSETTKRVNPAVTKR